MSPIWTSINLSYFLRINSCRQVQDHYRQSLRVEFIAHSDEDDSEFLEILRNQALEDAAWILQKYKTHKPEHPGR